MIPRGEVGLIFASIGASLTLHGKPVIDSATYGVVVIMVIVTTLVTPPLIKWRFGRLVTPLTYAAWSLSARAPPILPYLSSLEYNVLRSISRSSAAAFLLPSVNSNANKIYSRSTSASDRRRRSASW